MTEFIKKLNGHSGCGLELYRRNDIFFVRKNAGVPTYNSRLKKQLVKQKKFDSSSKLKTPKILGYGMQNGLFYFDMEYISGTTLNKYMHNINIGEIEYLIDLLFSSLAISGAKKDEESDAIFKHKITDLENQLTRLKNPLVEQSLSILKVFDFSDMPKSFCCGDLTFENIIITPNHQIYLIDFLDSFYNSWLMDIAKLFQDLETGWSYRNSETNFNLNLRLNTAKQAIKNRILNLDNGQKILITVYHILLLNILRIYPYSKDEKTINFLNDSLSKILQELPKLK